MDVRGILDDIESYLLASGHFDRVNMHEPKSAPGNGINASVWAQSLMPVPKSSGLNSTTVRLELNLRISMSMLAEPQDVIDTNMLLAVDSLFNTLSGDFTLGGDVKEVDLLGECGAPLSARAGYFSQDKKLYRSYMIVLPIIINDNWAQVE